MRHYFRGDWTTSYHKLYTHKQGNNKRNQKETCVFKVTNVSDYIGKLCNADSEQFSELKDGDFLDVCIDLDAGGGRVVAEYAILNQDDRKIKLHPILIYEGTDVRENLEITIGTMSEQIKDLEGSIIEINGKKLVVKVFGVFDLCALNSLIGKQNHSATYFDAWTNCTLAHIRNHKKRKHSQKDCKDVTFVTMDYLVNQITNHSVETGPESKTGKHFGSVVGENLIPLKNIFHYITPLMHTVMGLGNDTFNDLKKLVIKLDIEESDVNSDHQKNIQTTLSEKYIEKEEYEDILANTNLARMVVNNDLERIHFLLEGKEKDAEAVAEKNYSKSNKSRRKKEECDAEMCLLFPVDVDNDWDESFDCENGCKIHIRCEGLTPIDENYQLPEKYMCNACVNKSGNKVWLHETLIKAQSNLTLKIRELSKNLNEVKMKIEDLEERDSNCGKRQKILKQSCKNLNLNPARYHGGDFEGKAIQQLLSCASDGTFSILECISDKPTEEAKYKRALTNLYQVSHMLKSPIETFDDDDLITVRAICEQWGEDWTNDFENCNLTPKGHVLSFVLPKLLEVRKSFYMFYKMEERGESIHAELNDIERKIWCIRNKPDKLWKYIERFELRNHLDISIVTPFKRVFKNSDRT